MNLSPLPVWLQYMQAIALIAIPAVGAWLALQQVRIARVKLQHDLYDRRYKIFDATRNMIREVFRNKTITREALNQYWLDTSDATFLLNDRIGDYLFNIMMEADEIEFVARQIAQTPPGPAKDEMEAKQKERALALHSHIEVLRREFRPFLELDQVRPLPPVRWWRSARRAWRDWRRWR